MWVSVSLRLEKYLNKDCKKHARSSRMKVGQKVQHTRRRSKNLLVHSIPQGANYLEKISKSQDDCLKRWPSFSHVYNLSDLDK